MYDTLMIFKIYTITNMLDEFASNDVNQNANQNISFTMILCWARVLKTGMQLIDASMLRNIREIISFGVAIEQKKSLTGKLKKKTSCKKAQNKNPKH